MLQQLSPNRAVVTCLDFSTNIRVSHFVWCKFRGFDYYMHGRVDRYHNCVTFYSYYFLLDIVYNNFDMKQCKKTRFQPRVAGF